MNIKLPDIQAAAYARISADTCAKCFGAEIGISDGSSSRI